MSRERLSNLAPDIDSDPVQSTGTVVNERNLSQTFNSGLSNVVNGINVNQTDNSKHISTAERYDALLRDTPYLTGIHRRDITMINSDNIQSLNQTVTTDNMMDKRFNDLLSTIQQSSIQREQNLTDSLKNFMINRFKEFEQEYHYDSEYTCSRVGTSPGHVWVQALFRLRHRPYSRVGTSPVRLNSTELLLTVLMEITMSCLSIQGKTLITYSPILICLKTLIQIQTI